MQVRTLVARVAVALAALVPFSLALPAGSAGPSGPPSEPRWSVALSTAPHAPQDVWVVAQGNNADGWLSGGCLSLAGLARGPGRSWRRGSSTWRRGGPFT